VVVLLLLELLVMVEKVELVVEEEVGVQEPHVVVVEMEDLGW
jgi:hypothetical protein